MKTLIKKVSRTFSIGLRANQERRRDALWACLQDRQTTAIGVAVARILATLQQRTQITRDAEGNIVAVDLFLPLPESKRANAEELIAFTPEKVKKIKKLRRKLTKKRGPRGAAIPLYQNSYRMQEIIERNGETCVRNRVAEAYHWKPIKGRFKDQWQRAVDKIDATIGFQGLIKSWMPIEWGDLAPALRAGACQKAAQDFNSNIGLLAKGQRASFPSLQERDPARRLMEWRQAARRLACHTHLLPEAPARVVYPERFEEEDAKGDRLVINDPDHLTFVASPFPGRQSQVYVKSNDVVVYRHKPTKRLYAAFPLPHNGEGWWRAQAPEFLALPLWGERALKPGERKILFQLETRNQERLEKFLEGGDGRAINWSLTTEGRCGGERHKNKRQWTLHLATSRLVEIPLRPNILGIHFGLEPMLWWTLINTQGHVIGRSCIQSNVILTEALAQQLKLVKEQGKQRWVGGKKFAKELRRRTDEVAKLIVELAVQHDASLALEKIRWVDKQHGAAALNRRHSMWNFSQLPDRIEWLGHERRVDDQDDPIATIWHESDFVLRHTCRCGTCRQPKQTKTKAATYLKKGVLHCRKCGREEPLSDEWQAELVARAGLAKHLEILAKPEEE